MEGGINMSLAEKIEEVLKDELKQEDIKTVIDLAEFLKFKNEQNIWTKINEKQSEYITVKETHAIEEIIKRDEFIDQDNLLQELGINKDEV